MMEWQPIETAPKDGTLFLGWCTKSRRVLVSQHYTDRFGGKTLVTETWPIDPTGRLEADPHLWQPLPDPPKEGSAT